MARVNRDRGANASPTWLNTAAILPSIEADKLTAQAVTWMKEVTNLEKQANIYYTNYVNTLPTNPTLAAQYKSQEIAARNAAVVKRAAADQLFLRANEIRAQAGMDVKDRISQGKNDPRLKTSTGGGGKTSPAPKPQTPYQGAYKYNLPMVKTAYFSSLPSNPQQLNIKATISDPGNYTDAANAWSQAVSGGPANRGAIQMDRILSTSAKKPTGKAASTYDGTMYGFKFLYNPSSVTMTWGLSTEVNWDYVSGGFDKATPLAEGLLKSTVSFSILLNRIEDFAYIYEYGLKPQNKTDEFYVEERLAARNLKSYTQPGINPYSVQPDAAELAELYKKGTMYDVEYLFKTIMGKNATYNSSLNGKTADRGWLNGTPVELHLGEGLRYRVRISDLSISHAMFNDRMVPILSTLNITCTRFYDAPDYVFTNEPTTTSSGTKTTSTSTSKAVTARGGRRGADQ